ncbi:sulfite exporter TauE/SafE family protein [Pseudoruegeria sp. M32A2M]|nr:sulfite exporter TauE/SafE family protein [Pseudoruegeria sp. M32A2M]
MGGLPPQFFVMACGVALVAAFVKGATGFAMPMIMVSGMAAFLSPEMALAGLILPTVITNGFQAFRDGVGAAMSTIKRYRLYLGVGAIFLIGSAQLVRTIDERVLFGMIGFPIIGFGLLQLAGIRPRIPKSRRIPAEIGLGTLSGIIGGVSGVWGPPLVLYLTATSTPKGDQLRTLGVAFGLGAILLFVTHLQTGVLNARTLPFSAAMVLPALLGMRFGQRVQDRLDQEGFRKVTLLVLILAGLNLIRRAVF